MKTLQTWNQHVVKKENKSLVLETIIRTSPISRAKVASLTGLNKGTVSSLVSELLDEKLINDSGPGKSSGGRRPLILHFNKTAGFSIGIDLGVNYILGVLTDLEGNNIQEKTVYFTNLSYEEISKKLFSTIDYLFERSPTSAYGIVGIGIGVPGTVSKDGEILLAPNLDWKNINLKAILQKKYNLPVIIENEANAGAHGEKRFGVGKDFDNIVYVSVGMGIGVGLILNGNIYKGNNGFSGELGHMTIEVNGLKCRCGNEGCWELYASEQALLKNALQQGITTSPNKEISFESLYKLAENGDKETIKLFEQIGDYLGVGINNIINTFNPQQVIIGNRIASAQKWIQEPLKKRMINQTLWFQQRDLQIDFSELSTHSAALGVAAYVIEAFFKNDTQPKNAI
ncbi:glucokinase-like ROK family protein [Virgibacillus halotolerans]|uniref:ROK family transcriptional regulator n=1 Tax=Virgibacillus halotolerans TaxID=1071053 RepID=UPI001961E886|nr:ROK family transcriptional regulator [Virgibacillus halotolerans]MBM7600064.1 glucokinase-like ROK family protein [Virgibacillus halotolerans]